MLLTTKCPVKVLGMDVTKYGLEIRKKIGVILQQPSYEWNLTVENNMLIYGTLWNITLGNPTPRYLSKLPEPAKKRKSEEFSL